MNTVAAQEVSPTDKAEWQIISEVILRVGDFSSLDDLLHRALNSWLEQTSPELRWKVAIELYTAEEISSGRAAEIAGLNYFVFLERLREQGIPFIAAEDATGAEREQEEALVDELYNFSKP